MPQGYSKWAPTALFLLLFLAAPEKPEPPRNGIKNRALLCFEVPVASGPGVYWETKTYIAMGGRNADLNCRCFVTAVSLE